MPLLARRAASAIERTLVYFRTNMYIRLPMHLSSGPAYQSILGRCWTRTIFRDGFIFNQIGLPASCPVYPHSRPDSGHPGSAASCRWRSRPQHQTRKSSLQSRRSARPVAAHVPRNGPPVRCPSRRRAIPKDHLLGQIDEGAQARGHVAASWIIEAISGIGGCPLA